MSKYEPRQLTYESHPVREDRIPFYFGTYTNKSCVTNWHSNPEVLLFHNQTATVFCDGRYYTVEPAQLFFVNSNRIHFLESEQPVTYSLLIIDESFCMENGLDLSQIIFQEITDDPAALEKFNKIKEVYEDKKNPLRILETRSKLLDFLCCVSKYCPEQKEVTTVSVLHPVFQRAVSYISENFRKELTLEEIAGYCNVSKGYLTRTFKKTAGITIFAYIAEVRCKEAQFMLSNGHSVTATALHCGFDNMSYFSKTYRKIIGELPSATKSNRQSSK